MSLSCDFHLDYMINHRRSWSRCFSIRQRCHLCIINGNRRVSDKNQLKQLFIHSLIPSPVRGLYFVWFMMSNSEMQIKKKDLLEHLVNGKPKPKPSLLGVARLMTLVPVARDWCHIFFRFTFNRMTRVICSRIWTLNAFLTCYRDSSDSFFTMLMEKRR